MNYIEYQELVDQHLEKAMEARNIRIKEDMTRLESKKAFGRRLKKAIEDTGVDVDSFGAAMAASMLKDPAASSINHYRDSLWKFINGWGSPSYTNMCRILVMLPEVDARVLLLGAPGEINQEEEDII